MDWDARHADSPGQSQERVGHREVLWQGSHAHPWRNQRSQESKNALDQLEEQDLEDCHTLSLGRLQRSHWNWRCKKRLPEGNMSSKIFIITGWVCTLWGVSVGSTGQANWCLQQDHSIQCWFEPMVREIWSGGGGWRGRWRRSHLWISETLPSTLKP